MPLFKKARLLVGTVCVFFSGTLLSADSTSVEKVITVDYLQKESVDMRLSVNCSDDVCRYRLEPESAIDNPAKNSLSQLTIEGTLQNSPDGQDEVGRLYFHTADKEPTQIPLSIDFEDLQKANKSDRLTRAIITQLHPALHDSAFNELNKSFSLNNTLSGKVENKETYHLFKPSLHPNKEFQNTQLAKNLDREFLVVDLGDSYSMVIIYDHDNLPATVYVLDRWRLYRNPAVGTIIGYADMFSLVIHSYGAYKNVVKFKNSAGKDNVVGFKSLFGIVMHGVEIVDHAWEVGEFLNGGNKHYNDHHHSILHDLLGVAHLAHSFFELYEDQDLPSLIETVLTTTSFAYHHVPHWVYEHPVRKMLKPVYESEVSRKAVPAPI